LLLKRVLVSILLLPIGIAAVFFGNFPFYALVGLFLVLAAWEYVNLFRLGGLRPAGVLVVLGVLAFVIGRVVNDFQSAPLILSSIILIGMIYHLVEYERGCSQAGTEYGVTLAGILYIGWIGAYLISLRKLPDGEWWLLLVLPIIWGADAGAYFIGKLYGRRKLSPRLSPKKTWEGYIGGVVIATLIGGGLAVLWHSVTPANNGFTLLNGAVLGFVLSSTSVCGDLGESMFKRQVGAKDSGDLLPGHGGMFDRIDSWLWGAVIGYYVIVFLIR
jgi:phosphatidate cytidylyltransferase